MKSSRRARRMERHHARARRGATITLTSMMDIFTILLAFLLVNAADIQMLPTPRDMTLPESTARKDVEHEVVVVMLTHDQILVNGKPVISYAQVMASDQETIPALAAALVQEAKDLDTPEPVRTQAGPPPQGADSPQAGETRMPAPVGRGRVAIMADKGLPYRLIRKVMLTSTAAEFGRISLAVLQDQQG